MAVQNNHPDSCATPRKPKLNQYFLGRMLRRCIKNKEGVTAIEFAAVGLPFFMLVLGIMELGLAFFVNRVLDNATLESARLIRTGQAQHSNFNAVDFKKDVCARLTAVFCSPVRLIVDVRKYDSFTGITTPPDLLNDKGEPNDENDFSIGEGNDIIVVRTLYRWPMFTSFLHSNPGDTGDGDRLIYSTAVFRNEPFPSP
ncbi:TadE/TadG family type IV pilus assembly protein [Roseibium algae]|uniref:TadE/TadG family type IV pilus assembly protein n=1 Tax=Roseibium algae TaxID=3123038 RepID=A0ABU8TPW9_9HYPH